MSLFLEQGKRKIFFKTLKTVNKNYGKVLFTLLTLETLIDLFANAMLASGFDDLFANIIF